MKKLRYIAYASLILLVLIIITLGVLLILEIQRCIIS
jgi:hypothetical protein